MEFLEKISHLSNSKTEIIELSGTFPWGYFWFGIVIAILLYIIYEHFSSWYKDDIALGVSRSQAFLKTGFRILGIYMILSPWWVTGVIWLYGMFIFHGERMVTSLEWNSGKQILQITDNYYRTYRYPFSDLSHLQLSIPSEDKKVLKTSNVFYSRLDNEGTISILLITRGHETFTLANFPQTYIDNNMENLQGEAITSGRSMNRNWEYSDVQKELEEFGKIFSIPLYSIANREKIYSELSFRNLLQGRGLRPMKSREGLDRFTVSEKELITDKEDLPIDLHKNSEFIIQKGDYRKGFGLIFSYVGNLFNIAILVFLPLFSYGIYHLTTVFEKFKTFWVQKFFGKILPHLNKEYNTQDFWKSRFFIVMNLILFFLALGFIQSQDRARLVPSKILFKEHWFVYEQLKPGKDFNPNEYGSIDFLVDVYLADPFSVWDKLRDLANLDFEKYQISYHNIEFLYQPVFWQGENQISIKDVNAKDRYILFWDGFDPLVSDYLLYRLERKMEISRIDD